MVAINDKTRKKVLKKKFGQQNRHLLTHYFHIAGLFLLCAVCALYFFLLHKEKHLNQPAFGATAMSAKRIMASHKPFLLYGTAWKKEQTSSLVSQAVRAGFRFIDTACQPRHYNEPGVGIGWSTAAEDLGLQRSDLFLQTKFTSIDGQDRDNVPYDPETPLEEQVRTSLKVSLENLKTTYLDSLVLHSPMNDFDDTMKVWRTMESFVDDGTVRRLGISNCYDLETFQSLHQQARVKPTVLQNRFRAETNFDTELRQFCQSHNIWYQSFWTLTANRDALNSPEAVAWATEKNLTPQTLMFAFLMELGYITPLSGTTDLDHMKEDVAIMERVQRGEKLFESAAELHKFARILGMPDL